MSTDTITIKKLVNCARCGGAHENVVASKLTHSVWDSVTEDLLFNYWAPCPVNGEPIMVLHIPSSVDKMDKFTRAYIAIALWSSTDDDGEPLDGYFSSSDISKETLQNMAIDCEKFQRVNAELLAQVPTTGRGEWHRDEQSGHDFWLSRNGHGAGFFDRGYGDLGKKLQEAAKAFGPVDLYVDESGVIRSTP